MYQSKPPYFNLISKYEMSVIPHSISYLILCPAVIFTVLSVTADWWSKSRPPYTYSLSCYACWRKHCSVPPRL